MSQWWIVVPIVVFAAVYVVRTLLPASRRRSVPGGGCHDCAASAHGSREAESAAAAEDAPIKR